MLDGHSLGYFFHKAKGIREMDTAYEHRKTSLKLLGFGFKKVFPYKEKSYKKFKIE